MICLFKILPGPQHYLLESEVSLQENAAVLHIQWREPSKTKQNLPTSPKYCRQGSGVNECKNWPAQHFSCFQEVTEVLKKSRKINEEMRTVHSSLHSTEAALQTRSAVSYHFPDKPQCNSGNLILGCPWKRLQVLMQSYIDGTKELKSSRKTKISIVSMQPLGVNAPSPTYGKVTQSWSPPISY